MTDHTPPTEQQLDEIEARANAATPGPWKIEQDYCDCSEYGCSHPPFAVAFGPFASFENTTDRHHYDAEFAAHARVDVPALVAEVRRLRAALEQIRHLHKDSPMGPCPVCIDADAIAEGRDGLMPYPCPTGRLAGAQDCEPPHVRAARYEAAGNAMAASLCRDGFGDDEIADILGAGVTDGEASEPTLLRWGLDDVMWGDDDSVTVLLSGPAGEPYWLELDPERAAALRQDLAGPDGAQPLPSFTTADLQLVSFPSRPANACQALAPDPMRQAWVACTVEGPHEDHVNGLLRWPNKWARPVPAAEDTAAPSA